MDIKPHNINLQIYAKSEEEAERGRKAIIQFINILKENGAAVTGEKLVEAVGKLSSSPFVSSQIINFFRK